MSEAKCNSFKKLCVAWVSGCRTTVMEAVVLEWKVDDAAEEKCDFVEGRCAGIDCTDFGA